MTSEKQTNIARRARAAAVTAVFALQTCLALQTLLALQTPAQAQVGPPALFVAPDLLVTLDLLMVTAPAATPAAMPAVVTPAPRPASDAMKQDVMKPAAAPPPAPIATIACSAPAEFSRFDRPLLRTMRQLASGEPLTIVAIGSSSTAGAGASSPDASYPSRLAVELRQRFPGHQITVLNRGINGEETDQMMARFAADVIAAHPQLVLWQVGTNSVLRDRPLDAHEVELHDGIEQLKAADADIVLIDPQFAPAVNAKSETADMVEQIALAAKTENVDLFRRFAVMRNWYEVEHLAFTDFVSPDQLHMNDWSYDCWAKLMGGAIADAATRPIASAAVRPAVTPAKSGIQ
jgi:lysophospholipase L1-like esterase